jgi:hypothetical protein
MDVRAHSPWRLHGAHVGFSLWLVSTVIAAIGLACWLPHSHFPSVSYGFLWMTLAALMSLLAMTASALSLSSEKARTLGIITLCLEGSVLSATLLSMAAKVLIEIR